MIRERSTTFYISPFDEENLPIVVEAGDMKDRDSQPVDIIGLLNTTENKIIATMACLVGMAYELAGADGALLCGGSLALAALTLRPKHYAHIHETLSNFEPVALLYNHQHPLPPPKVKVEGNITHITEMVRIKNTM